MGREMDGDSHRDCFPLGAASSTVRQAALGPVHAVALSGKPEGQGSVVLHTQQFIKERGKRVHCIGS